MRLREPHLPTPSEAAIAWVLGVCLLIGIGLSVGAVAVALAVGEGFTVEAAFALVSDPDTSPLVQSPAWISANIALNELALLVLMFFWLRRLRVPLSSVLPLGRPSLRALCGALLLPFGFAPLAEVAAELVVRVMPDRVTPEHVVVAVAGGTSPGLLLLVLLAAAVLPAVAEEAMFRGFITTAFRRSSPLIALLIPSLLFGLFHLEPSQAAGTVVLGAAFGLIRLYTGSIWPCMLSHFGYNAGVLLEARWFGVENDHVIHWGRVGFGLLLAVAAYVLLVGDLWRRHLARLSFRPPPGGAGP